MSDTTEHVETSSLRDWVNQHWIIGIVALVVLVAGYASLATCAFSIQSPPVLLDDSWCQKVAANAVSRSAFHATTAALLALFATISGLMAAHRTGDKDWFLIVIPVVATPLAFILYNRSNAALELAASVNDARMDPVSCASTTPNKSEATDTPGGMCVNRAKEEKVPCPAPSGAFHTEKCAAAWSDWVRSKVDANAIGQSLINDSSKSPSKRGDSQERQQKADAGTR